MDKRCSRCRATKPADAFNRSGGGRLDSQCRACRKEVRDALPPRQLAEKLCPKCGLTKSAAEFYSNPQLVSGLSSACRECLRQPSERLKLRCAKYGITVAEFAAMLVSQNLACPVCLAPLGDSSLFHVDHDHRCCPGKKSCGACVRGILHNRCNQAIGLLGENADALRRAADYVARVR